MRSPLAALAATSFALMAVLPSCAAPSQHEPPSTFAMQLEKKDPLSEIRRDAISAHIRFLADDLLEGRGTGERGHRVAAAYVATQLQALGIEPAGDNGSYFQDVPMRGASVKSASMELVSGTGKVVPLVNERDFLAAADYNRGEAHVEAPLVFLGYGISEPDYHYDDLHARDVHGKVVVLLQGAPPSRPNFFPDVAQAVAGDRSVKVAALEKLGAAGVIFVTAPLLEERFPWDRAVKGSHFERVTLVEDGKPREGSVLPRFFIPSRVLDAWLAEAGRSERIAGLAASADAGHPQTFDFGLSVRLSVQSPVRSFSSPNVVGRLTKDRGSPLASEAVLFSAHLDHLGIGDPVNGDAIYNGAGDDAAGCAMVLEIARAFAQSNERPKRSLLFAFFTGEEKGLLGSDHLAQHPPVPLDHVAAVIQSDFATYPILPLHDIEPLGADHSTLEADVRDAARAMNITLSPDSRPEEVLFIRSDHYAFVRRGVPAISPVIGLQGATPQERSAVEAFEKARFHQPADEWEPKRDYQPLADFARFQFLFGLSIANRTERPHWKPHDYFERFTHAPH